MKRKGMIDLNELSLQASQLQIPATSSTRCAICLNVNYQSIKRKVGFNSYSCKQTY